MRTIDQIEEQICSTIRTIDTNLLKGDGAWTKAIFKAIADLGVSLNYKICSSRSDGEYDGGWLYDLIWYENDELDRLKSLPLVLESEWNTNFSYIKYDFEKLLVARSKYKVMIFQAKGAKMEEYFKKLEAGIAAFHVASEGENYLLVCFDEDNWVFQIKIVKIEKSIHVTRVIEVAAQPALTK